MIWLLLASARADPAASAPDEPTEPAMPTSPSLGAIPAEVLRVAASVRNRPLPERMGAI